MSVPIRPPAPVETRTSSITIILDRPDLMALVQAGRHPAALVCGRCGIRQGHHRPSEACPRFVRPELPPGYQYADQLVPGQRFRFLPMSDPECLREVESSTCCITGRLIAVRSRSVDCPPATHWLDSSLVVAATDVSR